MREWMSMAVSLIIDCLPTTQVTSQLEKLSAESAAMLADMTVNTTANCSGKTVQLRDLKLKMEKLEMEKVKYENELE